MTNSCNIALILIKEDIEIVKNKLALLDVFKSFQISSLQDNSKKELLRFYIMPEYNPSQTKFILFSPKSNPKTTIFFANVSNGWPEIFEGYYKELNFEIYYFLIHEERYEAYHFCYFHSDKKRNILCYQDPKWVFYEEGIPLPLEDTDLYKSKNKRDRLNKCIIMRYLQRAGWNIEDKNFWHTNRTVYLYEQH